MGSEMCIRDRADTVPLECPARDRRALGEIAADRNAGIRADACSCLLYTSDAADERSSVDLGGRRIIKKKNKS